VLSRIFTIGHSNHEAGAFLKLLAQYRIKSVIDVRSIPSSGRFPQFKKRNLESLCSKSSVSYRHAPELGNKVDGIARLLQRPEGQRALVELAAASDFERANVEGATAYMCAEADWRDCHRQVIAQRLREDFGVVTTHILRDGRTELHPAAHVLPASYGMTSLVSAFAGAPGHSGPCCGEEMATYTSQDIVAPPPPPWAPAHAAQGGVEASEAQGGPPEARDEAEAAPSTVEEPPGPAEPRKRRWGNKRT